VILGLAGCHESRDVVSGRYIDRFYTRDGVVDRRPDLTGLTFQIFVDGVGWPITEGTRDGTVYIPGVPEVPYVLKSVDRAGRSTWWQRESHQFERVTNRVGRPDAIVATSTPMRLQLDGLASWNDGDALVVNCWENGTEHYPVSLDPPLAVGATRVNATFDWADADWGPYLLDADASDTLTLSRIAKDRRADVEVDKLTQVVSGPAESQRDGQSSSFTAQLIDVPATTSVTFRADLDALASMIPAPMHDWSVSLITGPASSAFSIFGPGLIGVGRLEDPSSRPFATTETYGNPFDTRWPVLASGRYRASGLTRLPDGSILLVANDAYDVRYLEADEYVFRPVVQPARSGTLNGYSLAGDVPVDTHSPVTLRLDLEMNNEGFEAEILRLRGAPGSYEHWTTIASDGREITLPGNVLPPGSFVLRVHVGRGTDTSSSGVYSVIGPFRVVDAH
jgi:hypothetical protein